MPIAGLSKPMVEKDGSAIESSDSVYKLADIDEPPRLIKAVQVKIPFNAASGNIKGRVLVSAVVTKEGTPKDLEVVEAEPEGLFEDAALEAIWQYRFTPAKKDGEAVAVRIRIPVKF
jgi:protein TonB